MANKNHSWNLTAILWFSIFVLVACGMPTPTKVSSIAQPQSSSGKEDSGSGVNTTKPLLLSLTSLRQTLPPDISIATKKFLLSRPVPKPCLGGSVFVEAPQEFYLGESVSFFICNAPNRERPNIEVTMPNGSPLFLPSQSIKIEETTLSLQATFTPTISTLGKLSPGKYTFVFSWKAKSVGVTHTLELKPNSASQIFYVLSDGFFFDRYRANEVVRLFIYDPDKFMGWVELNMDSKGQSVVQSSSNDLLTATCYTTIGKQSGELTIAALGFQSNVCNGIIKRK